MLFVGVGGDEIGWSLTGENEGDRVLVRSDVVLFDWTDNGMKERIVVWRDGIGVAWLE